jgi:hypothetical protein
VWGLRETEMTSVLITILIYVLVGAVIAGIVYYAPFIPQPMKQWVLYAIGAVFVVLIVLALIPLLQGAAVAATPPA